MTTTSRRPRTRRPPGRSPLVALGLASVLFIASVVLAFVGVFGPAPWRSTTAPAAAGADANPWPTGQGGMMGGRSPGQLWGGGSAGMMAGQLWLAGNGQQVTTIADARARATQAGATDGLHPGEVIQFTDNFYVELKDATGASATEVLVDPATGAVGTEPGPAMMWSTGSRTGTFTETQARAAATAWLASNRPGETVSAIDAYPGYYTAETQVNGKVAGMLSVNADTGAVWYHTWHGTFVAMEDG